MHCRYQQESSYYIPVSGDQLVSSSWIHHASMHYLLNKVEEIELLRRGQDGEAERK
uniref:Uncharacterized protein n=1 Tax=Arundo donax TaxID=35708 RepID=A0A0A8YLQ5_ARUDO